jgi:hypothetical protein
VPMKNGKMACVWCWCTHVEHLKPEDAARAVGA